MDNTWQKKIWKRKLMSVVPSSIEMLLSMKIINIPPTQDWTDRIKEQLKKISINISKNIWASLEAQTVKRLPAMRETWVRFLGREDPLEREMAIHSSTLAWRIPWMEEPGRLQSMGSLRVRHD